MARKVRAVYRSRHCGAVYKVGEFDSDNLNVIQMVAGLYQGMRVPPAFERAALWDIYTCDACVPKYGIGDLVGWEA